MPEPDARGTAKRGVERVCEVRGYYMESTDEESFPQDILADLRHYCQCFNVDFQRALEMSEMHYEAERIRRFSKAFKEGL